MAVPKRKVSKARRDKRRSSHWKLEVPGMVACPKCGADIVMKWGKRRTVFYSCERYPECDYSSWDMPSPEKCPDCGEILYHKKGKNLLVCKKDGCGYKREIESETTES